MLAPIIELVDFHPDSTALYAAVVAGLQQTPKSLPSKLFYDATGSALFDAITALPEYYPTRTEEAILNAHIEAIVGKLGPHCLLIEFGSGSSRKTRVLLDHLQSPAGYVPVDIARDHLQAAAQTIAAAYPGLAVMPVCADYETEFAIPEPPLPAANRVIYYPGSTVGNFHPKDAATFLRHVRRVCGHDCALLIGVDLKKDVQVLHDAYNDSAGVTAEFNLNLLGHLNQVLGADFNLDAFEHCAFYNQDAGRIEMHLVSQKPQTVHVLGETIAIGAGERIWTESSYKYSVPEFAALAGRAGFQLDQVWVDDQNLFSIQYYRPAAAAQE